MFQKYPIPLVLKMCKVVYLPQFLMLYSSILLLINGSLLHFQQQEVKLILALMLAQVQASSLEIKQELLLISNLYWQERELLSLTMQMTLRSQLRGGGGGLGDLEFLRDKELAGDMILSNVAKTVIGVGASIIPAIGKTFFHVKSHLSPVGIASNNTRAELRNDGTRIDAMAYSSNNAVPDSTPGDSKVGVADSLIGDGAKAFDINIISLTGAPTINTSMQGWIQDT